MTQFHQDSATVLCIGGTESAGLAGLAADIRTQSQLGGHALPVVSAVTAQGATSVTQPVSPELLLAQLDAAIANTQPHAIKVGLLPCLELANTLVDWVVRHKLNHLPLVFDPVLSNTPGQSLIKDDPIAILQCLQPICDLITPNAEEADRLLSSPTSAPTQIVDPAIAHWSEKTEQQAHQWANQYPSTAILIKGGHQPDATNASDFYVGGGIDENSHHALWITKERLNLPCPIRGTGCTLASAIAQWLGRGFSCVDAAALGRQALHQMLETHKVVALNNVVLNNVVLNNAAIPHLVPSSTRFPIHALPLVSQTVALPSYPFPECHLPSGEPAPLGIYPVVDSLAWLQRLLPLGISTLQIRIKDKSGDALKKELSACIALAKQHNARLFINDFWALAIELGAYGVHLGQEDLLTADFAAIADAGLRLGLSSHCHFEVAQAIAINPSYIATGPVFPTTSKEMPWKNQGVDGVRHWKQLLTQSNYARPLVAIGGIQEHQVADIRHAGADSIAVISAITQASEPEKAAETLQSLWR